MKENVERSDPVDGFTDVTPEQLDELHKRCHKWECNGANADRLRRLERLTNSLSEVNSAISAVQVASTWTTRVIANGSPYGHVEVADDPDGLATWERELLAGVEAERELAARATRDQALETLQAGLQHQRIGDIAIW